jgi:hypothetical protein
MLFRFLIFVVAFMQPVTVQASSVQEDAAAAAEQVVRLAIFTDAFQDLTAPACTNTGCSAARPKAKTVNELFEEVFPSRSKPKVSRTTASK